MNTNNLKRFAREARIKLLDQVGRKLEFVLTHDTAELRGKQKEIEQLKTKIAEQGKEQVMETVAYTWFNRLMALRFMDANGYTIPKVVTPLPGMTNPEILQNALGGNIEPELKLDRQRLNDLLDGKTAATDAHTEAYKMLLVASCNQWHTAMPFMFERISDYTELLLSDDLLSDYSIVADIRNGMSEEDCQQEELIGWLYQFYIADKKDDVFEGLKKNIKITAENIPAATQLFTPRWIVRYMVENTLGKLWLTLKPNSKLRQHMPYYIEAPEGNPPAPLPEGIKSVTDIAFLDPCQGSGHVLVYTFDLFTKIYEEEGYNTNEIPVLILEHNLFGIDIDERAAQLAAFALTMKARSYYSRFLRKPVQPHVIALENVSEYIIKQAVKLPLKVAGKLIYDYRDLSLYNLTQADNFGSLIQIDPEELKALSIQNGSIWQTQERKLKEQAEYLSRRYHCVVTNPPYMGSAGMNNILRKYLDTYYTLGKADLMTCFMQRASSLCIQKGYWAMINLPSWMFLSTFEKFREYLIKNNKINNLLQLGRGIFGSDFGSVAFTIYNDGQHLNEKGVYRRLFIEHVHVRNIQVIENLFFDKTFGYFETSQRDFEKIPGSPLAYWLNKSFIESFDNIKIKDKFYPKSGLSTTDNQQFLRFCHEVELNKVGLGYSNTTDAKNSNKKWFPYNKGGDFRRWFGNFNYVVNWQNDGEDIRKCIASDPKKQVGGRIVSYEYYFQESINWSALSSGPFSCRYSPPGFLFDSKGPAVFFDNYEEGLLLLGFLNSKVAQKYLDILSPTLDYNQGPVGKIPYKNIKSNAILMIQECVDISKEEWNTRETSLGFLQNELVRLKRSRVQESCELFQYYWKDKFFRMHKMEEELNLMILIEYGLEDTLSAEIGMDEITLLKGEISIINQELVFDLKEILRQFISYSLGCIFGRFSHEKVGFILANRGETLEDFLKHVSNPTFMPDEDNIIPVLDDEWFKDDVAGRFKLFLKATFGEEHFEENLKYIEEIIGKDIRKYFVKDFYNDHIKRYKKRPIYWMFSSPKGHFKALIYMHRYQHDLCSKMLNDYLQAFISKLEAAKQTQTMLSLRVELSAREKTAAIKEIDKLELMLKDCREYEKTLFTIATQKVNIDLDDGVKVNYQKFKDVLVPIKGLEKEEE